MHSMGCRVTELPFFWCPRCGTIKPCDDTPAVVPLLVERCREFQANMKDYRGPMLEWKRTGIAESINTPEERP
jgi:hypothetical protein